MNTTTIDQLRYLASVPLAPNDNVTERQAEENRHMVRQALLAAASGFAEVFTSDGVSIAGHLQKARTDKSWRAVDAIIKSLRGGVIGSDATA